MPRIIRIPMAVVVVAALLLAAAPAPARSAVSAPPVARDPAVITTWDTIAVRTIIVEGQKPPPVAQLYLGFVSAAVYNAVITIDGRFAPTPSSRAPTDRPRRRRPPQPPPTGCSATTSRPRPTDCSPTIRHRWLSP